jgi:hypothetical protein
LKSTVSPSFLLALPPSLLTELLVLLQALREGMTAVLPDALLVVGPEGGIGGAGNVAGGREGGREGEKAT